MAWLWCAAGALLLGVLAGQWTLFRAAALDYETVVGADLIEWERLFDAAVLTWGLLCAALARAANRRPASCAQLACHLGAWALPALALWSAATLLHTMGFAGVSITVASSEAGALAQFLAIARLDNPWPMVGAGLAALLLGLGAQRQQTRDGSVRLALAALSANAAVHCAIAGFDCFVAGRIVARADALTNFLPADQLSGGALVLANLGLVVGFVLAARRARLASAAARRGLAATLTLTAAVTLLCSFDGARLTGVRDVARRLQLEAALAERSTFQPMVRTGLGGVVPDRLVLLSATGEASLMDAAGVRDLGADAALPANAHDRTLLADARLSVADLLRVLARVPEDQPLYWGSLRRLDTRGPSALAGVPPCRTTVASVPIVAVANGAEAPDIVRAIDLRQLPPTTRVSELTPDTWLLAPRAPARELPPQAYDSVPPPALSWRALASFYVLGW